MSDVIASAAVYCASEVAASYLTNNPLAATDVPALVRLLRSSFEACGATPPTLQQIARRKWPKPETGFIVCQVCGTEHKMLKRHLRTEHNLTVEDYRAQFGHNTPLVSAEYAQVRSQLAKESGLGKHRSKLFSAAA